MIDINLLLGSSFQFKNICEIYPPLVRDLTTQEYGFFQKIFTTSQEELDDYFQENNIKLTQTPFEYLMCNAYNSKEFEELVLKAFEFYTHQSATILYEEKVIVIGNIQKILLQTNDIKNLPMLTEDNFFDFQNAIRRCSGLEEIEKPNLNEHPRIREMKAKARLRDKVKAKKGLGIDLPTTLAAICCMGIGITPLNIGELTIYSIHILLTMMQNKEKYGLDIQSLLAGCDSKKIKPVYWIKNI